MQRIDADLFRRMLLAGARCLEQNRATVDALNVFPVPDGDTGTNMNLTMQSVVQAILAEQEPHVGRLGAACASGSLMGARGNSGVILSMFFRGFGRYLEGKESISSLQLVEAMQQGVDTVYKAVRKPVEGTILTVMRESAQAGLIAARRHDDVAHVMQAVVRQAEEALRHTPELLPVLKQAGVVDAGGQGLVFIYHGFLDAVEGRAIPTVSEPVPPVEPTLDRPLDTADIKFAYCTEFMIKSPRINEADMHQLLEPLGDSLLVLGDAQVLKVHVHTNDPGLALQTGLKYGELTGIKIENMKEQHTALYSQETVPAQEINAAEPPKLVGVVAVVAGDGMAEIFQSFGVDVIVRGGQTMNPSTEELRQAVDEVNAEHVIILPNNKNIIMTAEQVSEVTDKKVHVIPTRTLPQGLGALLGYVAEPGDLGVMLGNMERNSLQVKSGQVATAVRDHSCPVGEVKQGDYIGMFEKEIDVIGYELPEVVLDTIARMVDDDSGVITLFYGEGVSAEDAADLAARVEALYPDLEVEVHSGGQPVYHYIISVE